MDEDRKAHTLLVHYDTEERQMRSRYATLRELRQLGTWQDGGQTGDDLDLTDDTEVCVRADGSVGVGDQGVLVDSYDVDATWLALLADAGLLPSDGGRWQTLPRYREENTEGYTEAQLAELNRRWERAGGQALTDRDEIAALSEQILTEYDTERSRLDC